MNPLTSIVRRCATLVLILGLFVAGTAAAVNLDQAKAAGQVGERLDGYLGLVQGNAPADVRKLVEQINAQRRAEYERIARKNGVAVDQVARLTAKRVIEQTSPGQFYQSPDGGWARR